MSTINKINIDKINYDIEDADAQSKINRLNSDIKSLEEDMLNELNEISRNLVNRDNEISTELDSITRRVTNIEQKIENLPSSGNNQTLNNWLTCLSNNNDNYFTAGLLFTKYDDDEVAVTQNNNILDSNTIIIPNYVRFDETTQNFVPTTLDATEPYYVSFISRLNCLGIYNVTFPEHLVAIAPNAIFNYEDIKTIRFTGSNEIALDHSLVDFFMKAETILIPYGSEQIYWHNFYNAFEQEIAEELYNKTRCFDTFTALRRDMDYTIGQGWENTAEAIRTTQAALQALANRVDNLINVEVTAV